MRYLLLIVSAFFLFSCTEKELEPINKGGEKPGVVSIEAVESIAGGAVVFYRIPDVSDLLSVKAVYTITNGQKREANASYYDNHLILDGFADTLEHEAQLFAISRSQQISDPVPVKFTPFESPLSKTTRSVSIEPDYGGAAFSWINADSASLTFDLLTPDRNGNMQTVTIFQSYKDTVDYTIRGYLPEPRVFGLIVSDNYGNSSEMILPPDGQLTPLWEDRLDKSFMSIRHLDNDTYMTGWGFKDEFLIDDDLSTIGHSPNNSLPASFTVDLGQKVKLSRVVAHQRLFNDQYFNHNNPKFFEVYRPVLEELSQYGFWSDWRKIMTCTIVKPSGLSGTEVTNEDMRAAAKGHEFSFPRTMEPVRYVRFLFPSGSTWGNVNYVGLAELTFYGMYE
ncbi:hypothetical protein EZS27_010320 [termite gut metagenome]|uniref:DUF4959 domain-containing protein n=1 Tax=termite gut metagenome TaxID=433724 RepID=A0A5J4S713_9ZZZZ